MNRQDARGIFDRAGISISSWARSHGFSRVMVHHVLSGKVKGRRGEAHHIAVALGIKDGVPGGKPSDYAKLAKRSKSRKAK
jgi:gp16 family phage-associated protein